METQQQEVELNALVSSKYMKLDQALQLKGSVAVCCGVGEEDQMNK